ncbi:4-hydroxyphenylacetate 3-hydroxylase family protein [Methylobrevis albus]|uniref:4-hydroxyphenylacetate 3-monooxygenase n=1 Tax=Methylobrevis albus TaxID=2793297 RepID=A0A931I434_9HYPH|nr:4-hydroxyphenylacetate 3-hydroxylase N-terminal domain-containing protein [Methylobrevis albus]MBH0239114.1 4-hydroxyphenylacetate 3-monooxygenase [Methylobrevis albus]
MPVRDGNAYIQALRDGRRVVLDGRGVADVTTDPAYRGTVASFARLYDLQAAPENLELMTFETETGHRVNRAWQLPTSPGDLVQRRRAIEAWSASNFGWLGRSPDHLATALSGLMMGSEVMARHDPARAAAFRDYFTYARDRDLFVTYVIQNPQADKSKSPSAQARDVVLHIVDQDASGITVSGAKMLGTATVMSDEVFVGNIQPLKPGEGAYALSFAVPVATPGVVLLSRRSYETGVTSGWDYPLSSRFDENDAVVVFDEVKVPWERVFVCGDVAAARAQWHETPTHVYQNYQSQIRLMVKLRFLLGLARRIAEVNGSAGMPQVEAVLARLACEASIVEGMVAGMEAAGRRVGPFFVPSPHLLYAAQTYTQELYPRFVNAIRDLAGGGVIMLPSSIRDLDDPEIRRHIEGTQVSSVTDALGRIGVMKLAWDALGSEFASRHVQYEMFYAGASYVNHANVNRTYDWSAATALADEALALSPRPAFPAGGAGPQREAAE